ncbi:RNA recognition domain-containing protein [Colletotrichum orchidophilum]|uniref:RNA recognition domain-containing protein n=1 Tax=Colletotrichum orchidophilum TaxID=1209926 RepID=A0A1G4BCV0_9PEZI|nr:RNA recognition domain-containing protein [Colletotrichum orchidophilum]OHE99224.1 RNA recognition domain-containing protein [Colletotrichum orchidophilum]
MSGKLDQSLDEILSTQRRSTGGPGRRSQRRSTGGRPAAAAPVGGVQKTSRPARGAVANKPNVAKPAQGSGDSKVIVSNLPKDVNEQQIKDFVRHVISRLLSFPTGVVARSIHCGHCHFPNGICQRRRKDSFLHVCDPEKWRRAHQKLSTSLSRKHSTVLRSPGQHPSNWFRRLKIWDVGCLRQISTLPARSGTAHSA